MKTDQQHWQEFVVEDIDVFLSTYCGYWLRRVEQGENSRLVYVDEGWYSHGEEPRRQEAIDVWQGYLKQDMPEGYYVLDDDVARRSWQIAARRWGENWMDEVGDAETYDIALQEALLGEVVYS